MQTWWQQAEAWRRNPATALEEAMRRIAVCRDTHGERLVLSDLGLDRLPDEVATLTWLRELQCYGLPVSDFDALAPLAALEDFRAGSLDAPSPRLNFLAHCPSLRHLELIATTTLDLAPLAVCRDLTRLSISCSRHPVDLENLSALAGLRSLADVSLMTMRSDAFATIATWPALTSLSLFETDIDDLAGFDRLSELEWLDLHAAPVSDPSPLVGLPRLKHLGLAKTAIDDLAPLAGMTSLEELDVSKTRVVDLRPLASLGLRTLDLSGCPIADLAPVATLAALESIDVSGTSVVSLAPLWGLERLEVLKLNETAVRSLGPTGAFARLASLWARDSRLEDIGALAPGHRLQAIDLSNSRVADLTPLREAKDCRSIDLRGSLVGDLTPLLETSSREQDHRYCAQHLDFRDTPASRADPRLGELAALAERDRQACFLATKDHLRKRRGRVRTAVARLFGKA